MPGETLQAVRLAEACDRATHGLHGPAILSDRAFRPGISSWQPRALPLRRLSGVRRVRQGRPSGPGHPWSQWRVDASMHRSSTGTASSIPTARTARCHAIDQGQHGVVTKPRQALFLNLAVGAAYTPL